MSPSGKAPDFDSGTRRFKSGHPSQKIQVARLGFFHLCRKAQHHLRATHATSFEPWLNFIAARAAQMNDVALRANDVLRNDVGLRPMMLRFAQTN